jgi:hypothetical protein
MSVGEEFSTLRSRRCNTIFNKSRGRKVQSKNVSKKIKKKPTSFIWDELFLFSDLTDFHNKRNALYGKQ